MIGIFFRNLFRDLVRQPLRTALTLSGVVWGTFSVVLLIAFGDSVGKAQIKRFHGMGQGIVLAFPSRTTLPWQGLLKGKAVRITPEMVEAIPEKVPGIELISPEFVGSRLISYRTEGIPEHRPGHQPRVRDDAQHHRRHGAVHRRRGHERHGNGSASSGTSSRRTSSGTKRR